MKLGCIRINASSDAALGQIRKAETFFERGRGLLGSKGLTAGQGMLIEPCNSIHTFFMQFSIDAVFLGTDHRVVAIHPNIPPRRFVRVGRAASVLELMAGQVDQLPLTKGDIVMWEPLS